MYIVSVHCVHLVLCIALWYFELVHLFINTLHKRIGSFYFSHLLHLFILMCCISFLICLRLCFAFVHASVHIGTSYLFTWLVCFCTLNLFFTVHLYVASFQCIWNLRGNEQQSAVWAAVLFSQLVWLLIPLMIHWVYNSWKSMPALRVISWMDTDVFVIHNNWCIKWLSWIHGIRPLRSRICVCIILNAYCHRVLLGFRSYSLFIRRDDPKWWSHFVTFWNLKAGKVCLVSYLSFVYFSLLL